MDTEQRLGLHVVFELALAVASTFQNRLQNTWT